jgi:hypothetical protein
MTPMHLSYYYISAPDPDSADDSYDLTQECFHIDRTIVSDSEAEVAVREGNATPPHVMHSGPRDKAQLLKVDQGGTTCVDLRATDQAR